MRSAPAYGSGCSTTASITAKRPVLAAMPRVRMRIADAANPRLRHNARAANRTSCIKLVSILATTVGGLSFANQMWRISVDTDVLSDLILRVEIGDSLDDPGLRVGPGILDREFDFQVAQICAVKAFDDVQHFRVRMTDVVEPRLIVEPHRVHHQIISLPVADRVSHPIRIRILGVPAPIEKDLPMAGCVILEDHHQEGRCLNELVWE